MKDLEKENLRLRRAISDFTLDKLILQEASAGFHCDLKCSSIFPAPPASSEIALWLCEQKPRDILSRPLPQRSDPLRPSQPI